MNLAIIEQIALYIPLMLGAYISIGLMKIPNLSIETSFVFGAIMASQILMLDGNATIITLLLAIILSACAGALVNIVAASLAEYAHFSHILSAIITIGLFHGICQWIIDGAHVTISHRTNPLAMLNYIPQYPEILMVIIIAIILSLMIYYFMRTQLGVSCAIYGDNINFLTNYRINQSYVVISGMALSGALAGISGYMIAQNNGFVDTTMGTGIPLLCLSALIIGKSLMRSNCIIQILTPLLGITGYFFLQTGLLHVGFDLRYFTSVQAIIIALLLFISTKLNKNNRQPILGI